MQHLGAVANKSSSRQLSLSGVSLMYLWPSTARHVCRCCQGRLVSVLEGGYRIQVRLSD